MRVCLLSRTQFPLPPPSAPRAARSWVFCVYHTACGLRMKLNMKLMMKNRISRFGRRARPRRTSCRASQMADSSDVREEQLRWASYLSPSILMSSTVALVFAVCRTSPRSLVPVVTDMSSSFQCRHSYSLPVPGGRSAYWAAFSEAEETKQDLHEANRNP